MVVDASRPAWHCPKHLLALVDGVGALLCPEGCAYPVKAGIPRFVPESNYADSFGLQWNRYRRTQLDSYTGVPVSADRARRVAGEALWQNLAGRTVLEVGCGAGRFTEILLDRGASVVSVDLSSAVDANAENFPVSPRHRVAQADVFALPFPARQFDVVFCLGVIQHTPDPNVAIARLFDQVALGGSLLIDQYTYNLSWYTKTAPIFRRVLRRMERERAVAATERLVDVFLPLHTAVRRHPVAQKVVSRVSPVSAYYQAYPDLADEIQREWSLLDTHDSLTDWHRHLQTVAGLRTLLGTIGATVERCERWAYNVEARARR
jgi:2-polyprenyl-3-methyl-5-hydroxy-6-metoxy-1,4-benzoquinol methylase